MDERPPPPPPQHPECLPDMRSQKQAKPKQRQPQERQPRTVRKVIAVFDEGTQITEEVHLSPEDPKYYRRWQVTCPHHVSDELPCFKHRNCGAAQTSHFGDMEPAGFLVAWVRSCAHYENRNDHMDKKALPSLQDIQEAMQQECWEP